MLTRPLLRHLSAAAVAMPVGALAWFELGYLYFGATGDDPPRQLNAAFALLSFAAAFLWPLQSARRPAGVIITGCRAGIGLAILLPIVTIAVLLMWENAEGRRDLGMGGLVLYSLPVVALVVAAVLVIVFAVVRRLAARRLSADTP